MCVSDCHSCVSGEGNFLKTKEVAERTASPRSLPHNGVFSGVCFQHVTSLRLTSIRPLIPAHTGSGWSFPHTFRPSTDLDSARTLSAFFLQFHGRRVNENMSVRNVWERRLVEWARTQDAWCQRWVSHCVNLLLAGSSLANWPKNNRITKPHLPQCFFHNDDRFSFHNTLLS